MIIQRCLEDYIISHRITPWFHNIPLMLGWHLGLDPKIPHVILTWSDIQRYVVDLYSKLPKFIIHLFVLEYKKIVGCFTGIHYYINHFFRTFNLAVYLRATRSFGRFSLCKPSMKMKWIPESRDGPHIGTSCGNAISYVVPYVSHL